MWTAFLHEQVFDEVWEEFWLHWTTNVVKRPLYKHCDDKVREKLRQKIAHFYYLGHGLYMRF